MQNKTSLTVLFSVMAFMGGCGGSGSFDDLQKYIEKTKNQPGKPIAALPVFRPLPPFAYSATTLRSPFEKPVKERASVRGGKKVTPDLTRAKEYLENFSIANMTMVGTITKDGKLWALIDTGPGAQRSVEPVTLGNHIGRNYGKIIKTSPTQLEVMEIVSDGEGGWVERPRIIKLKEKE